MSFFKIRFSLCFLWLVFMLIFIKNVSLFAQDSTAFISPKPNNAWQFGEMYGAGLKKVATDSTGAIYITGYMTEEIKLGNKLLKEREGKYFLAKFLADGTLVWAFQLSTPIQKMAIAGKNIAIGGQFQKKCTIKNQGLEAKGDISVFFALLDTEGTLKFVKYIEGEPEVMFNYLAINQKGEVCITGSYTQKAFFEGKILQNTHSKNIFLANYTKDGKLNWVNTIAGGNTMLTGVHLRGLHTNKNGDWTIIGMISGKCYFAPQYFSLQSSHELYHGEGWMFNHDIFIAKYTQKGELKWAKTIAQNSEAQDLCADEEGNYYITGYFLGTNQKMGANFGVSLFGNTKLKANFLEKTIYETIFIYKISTAGQFMWVKKIEGKGNARGQKCMYNPKTKNVFVSGAFSNILSITNELKPKKSAEGSASTQETKLLDTTKKPEISVNADGKVHIFLVEFNVEGIFLNLTQSQSEESNELTDMTADMKGKMWFVGRFKRKFAFCGASLQTQGNSTNGFVIAYP